MKIKRPMRIAGPLALVAVVLCMTGIARAQLVTPADQAWSVRLNLPKFIASPVGQHLVDTFGQSDKGRGQLGQFSNALGIDITKDIGSAILYGKSLEPGSASLVVQLGQTPGNLAGLMLSLPDYQSQNIDDNMMLHSFNMRQPGGPPPPPPGGEGGFQSPPPPPPAQRVFVALPKAGDGHYMLVASRDREQVVGLAKRVAKGDSEMMPKDEAMTGSTVMKVHVGDLSNAPVPADRPGAAIAKSVKKLDLDLASGQQLKLDLDVTADSAARAAQFAQLLQGAVGAMRMRMDQQPEAKPMADALRRLQVTHDQDSADLSASLELDAASAGDVIDNAAKHLQSRQNRAQRHTTPAPPPPHGQNHGGGGPPR